MYLQCVLMSDLVAVAIGRIFRHDTYKNLNLPTNYRIYLHIVYV